MCHSQKSIHGQSEHIVTSIETPATGLMTFPDHTIRDSQVAIYTMAHINYNVYMLRIIVYEMFEPIEMLKGPKESQSVLFI